MLKAKSKELAQKYQVNVTLNDDSIAKYADQMTVESMEEDYKAFADMKKALQNGEGQAKSVVQNKPLSRKAFLKRRKSETETITPGKYNRSGSFDYERTINYLCCKSHVGFKASVSWQYSDGVTTCKLNSITFFCNNDDCNRPGKVQCNNCSFSVGETYMHTTGSMNEGNLVFSAFTSVSGRMCLYDFKNVNVSVYYNETINAQEISIGL